MTLSSIARAIAKHPDVLLCDIPEGHPPLLNRLYIRRGRSVEAGWCIVGRSWEDGPVRRKGLECRALDSERILKYSSLDVLHSGCQESQRVRKLPGTDASNVDVDELTPDDLCQK